MDGRFFTYESIFELSDTDIICFQSVYCNNDMTRHSKPFTMNEENYSDCNEAISYCLKQHFGSCLYAASFLKKHNIRFNETIYYSEDGLFFRKCIQSANRISLYNEPFYLYRNNVSSAVHIRNYGIEYYEPIFEAYLTDDEDGEGFLSRYVVDMIEEHFCHFGTISSLKNGLIVIKGMYQLQFGMEEAEPDKRYMHWNDVHRSMH